MADLDPIYGIGNLPTQTPAASSYLAVENSSATGKATLNDILGRTYASVAAGASGKFTFAANSRFVLLCFASTMTLRGMYMITTSASGVYAPTEVTAASDLTMTTSGLTVTIANGNSNNSVELHFIKLSGSVTRN